MRAVFDGATFLQHVDDVRVNYLRDAVRDYHHGAFFFNRVQAVLNLLGGDGVKAGGRFVQEDDRRVFQKEPRDGDALLLSAGEQLRVRFVPLRQPFDLLVQKGLAGRLFDLPERGFDVPVANVLFNRTFEDVILLQD
jgi:hypothetical protein